MDLRNAVNRTREKSEEFITTYGDIVREERFFCAVLFHVLLSSQARLMGFLKDCHVRDEHFKDLSTIRIFAEYAMARDLWHQFKTNDQKLKFIRDWITFPEGDAAYLDLDKSDVIEKFNAGLVSRPISKDYIQSPARWGIRNICTRFHENRMMLEKACMLKWAFNVKPDIVIELNDDAVVCIEAKVESGEGKYPSSAEDVRVLRDALDQPTDARGQPRVPYGQCEIQGFLLKEVLGFKPVYPVFLVANCQTGAEAPITNGQEDEITLKWSTAFRDADPQNPTVRIALQQIKRLEKLK
jgi:hypothetical protein